MTIDDVPENAAKVAGLLFIAGCTREKIDDLLLVEHYQHIAALTNIEPVDVATALLWLRDLFADGDRDRRRQLN